MHTLNQIKEIANDKSKSTDDRIGTLIQIGLDDLELGLGIVSNIVGDKYTVKNTNNPELHGMEFRTSVIYCAITLSLQEKKVLPVNHFAVSDFVRRPAYREFKLETYIGTPIRVNGNLYGTLNFTNPEPRDHHFSEDEKALVINLAEVIGNILGETA